MPHLIVLLIRPGVVATERQAYLAEFPGILAMKCSAAGMSETLEGVTFEDTGRCIRYDGTMAPW